MNWEIPDQSKRIESTLPKKMKLEEDSQGQEHNFFAESKSVGLLNEKAKEENVYYCLLRAATALDLY